MSSAHSSCKRGLPVVFKNPILSTNIVHFIKIAPEYVLNDFKYDKILLGAEEQMVHMDHHMKWLSIVSTTS